MDPFSVVIVGGGVAAMEGLLRLRRLAGDAVKVRLLAPNEDFGFRALSVKEPFAMGHGARHSVRHLARDAGAGWVRDTLSRVDLDGQMVHSAEGDQLAYDALLLAIGGRMGPFLEHAVTFYDQDADALVSGIVQDVEEGYSKRIAFAAPDGPRWLLPLYELALMTAQRARSSGMDDVEILLVTPEPSPLAGFGEAAGRAVAELLEAAGISVHCGALATTPAKGKLRIGPDGEELDVERVVAMPRVSGPGIRGLPGGGAQGFIPINERCAVPGTEGRVFAAGDATDFPIKHGGLGAQQADTAAAGIAALAGADVGTDPFRPVIYGKLLTGGKPLYMSARLVGGSSFESEVSDAPLWESGDKVVADELSAYLRRSAESG
jgi:sulfide:quinone oxidoreductase